VISVDINVPETPVGQFMQVGLADRSSINRLVSALPLGAHGLANIAGLPPTRPADAALKVNRGTQVSDHTAGAKARRWSLDSQPCFAGGLGWAESKDAVLASAGLDFNEVSSFCVENGIAGGRSYFFLKESLIVWTMQNRWTWRSRGIRKNAVSPGPVDTPILKDFIATLGARAEEEMKTMDRAGKPGDIAPVVAFLLSDGSTWIRGKNVPVDGGMYSNVLCGMHGF
jgi:NAD(P)-dependent dehydrogenase (short-subunit alcohol dehydrogenase family)